MDAWELERDLERERKKSEGLQKTIEKQARKNSDLMKENTRLRKDLGILDETGFIEDPSLPLIKFGSTGRPFCETHGAMLAYEHNIYRCEACKSAVQVRARGDTGNIIWAEIWGKKPLTDRFDAVFLKDEPAYWKKEMDKWLLKEVIPYIEAIEGKAEKLEAVQQWAFQMEYMYEDCSYLSHEAFDKDAKKALQELISIVGKWIPLEVRTSAEGQ